MLTSDLAVFCHIIRRTGVAVTTIGIIGAGMIGRALARLAVNAGMNVILSNSRDPGSLADLVSTLGPNVRAAFPTEAAQAGPLVVASIPLANYKKLSQADLAGKVVIDTMNYYPERDGNIALLDKGDTTSSELVQSHLADSFIVKAFNAISFANLASSARPAGASNRSALPFATDSQHAKTVVGDFVDRIGYDAVFAGSLAESWRFEPGTPVYVSPYMPSARPDNMSREEGLRWIVDTPGRPVPSNRVRTLLEQANRVLPGEPLTRGS
jgi:predicted dinucleotide-binding enzyme